MIVIQITFLSSTQPFSQLGQTVFDNKKESFNHQVDVSLYNKGVYYLQLKTEEGVLVEKIIVN